MRDRETVATFVPSTTAEPAPPRPRKHETPEARERRLANLERGPR